MQAKKLIKSKKNMNYNGGYLIITYTDQYDIDGDDIPDEFIIRKVKSKNPKYETIKKTIRTEFNPPKSKIYQKSSNIKKLGKYKKQIDRHFTTIIEDAIKNKIESDTLTDIQMMALLEVPESTFRQKIKKYANDYGINQATLKSYINGEIDTYMV